MTDPTGAPHATSQLPANGQAAYQPQYVAANTSPQPSYVAQSEPLAAEAIDAEPLAQRAEPAGPRRERDSIFSRSALVLIIAVAALFITAVLLILFNSTSESVNALAVVAVAIVSLTAVYFGVSLAVQQLREERDEKAAALARVAEAEASARESDVWSAQMEAGLRVAMVKLQAAGIASDDVVKAAGAPDDFF